MITDRLQLIVLARFEQQLHAAHDDGEFYELACRAEGCFCTDLGPAMRALVDHERSLRAVGVR